jgi:hypothetical protein
MGNNKGHDEQGDEQGGAEAKPPVADGDHEGEEVQEVGQRINK